MYRYVFISVFCGALLLAALTDHAKMKRRAHRNDELGAALRPLTQKLDGKKTLFYHLSENIPTDGLIRGRFVLAPLLLLPASISDDTVLLIGGPTLQLPGNTRQILWSYKDTGNTFLLTSERPAHATE